MARGTLTCPVCRGWGGYTTCRGADCASLLKSVVPPRPWLARQTTLQWHYSHLVTTITTHLAEAGTVLSSTRGLRLNCCTPGTGGMVAGGAGWGKTTLH